MAIISKETFDKLSDVEKEKLRKYLNNYSEKIDNVKNITDDIFGKENLQPKSKIKTWEDVTKEGFSVEEDYLCEFDNYDHDKVDGFTEAISYKGEFSDKLIYKAIATLRIAKLIELGYGGTVTDEEWKSPNEKFVIKPHYQRGKVFLEKSTSLNYKHFIAFHTYDQLEEFLSYPENVELVEQFFMF